MKTLNLKNLLKLTAIMLFAASAFACVKKEPADIETKGKIIAWLKCPEVSYEENESGSYGMTIGLYIVSETKDSLLSLTLPHSTVEHLLNVSVDTLTWEDPVRLTTPVSVVFSYRKAEDNELREHACRIFWLYPLDPLFKSTQIIISDIKKDIVK